MKTRTGKYDPATRTVPVTFTEGEIEHKRAVNACHDADGAYDAAATRVRVAEVARGVAVKIGLGVIAAVEDAPAA